MATTVLVDDRLLIEELLVGMRRGRRQPALHTTTTWWYRACRAAVVGAGGHLSGPFEQVGAAHQEQAILALLDLPPEIGLPDPRLTVPAMARLAATHPKLNLINLEAAAAALTLSAEVWLSEPTARGVLPDVLDGVGVRWRAVPVS